MKILNKKVTAEFPTTKENLWEILTVPKWTEKYMYNCQLISDLKVGSAIDWKGVFQGQEAFLTGKVLENEIYKTFKYSTIDPTYSDASDPNNFIHVTYIIEPQVKRVLLHFINETFDGNIERMKHIMDGLEGMILPAILKCVEEKNEN